MKTKKIEVIDASSPYGTFDDEFGLVPEFVNFISGDFFKFLEKRFTDWTKLKVIGSDEEIPF